MTDVADLRIRVASDDVPKATSRLGALTAAGGRAERATDGLVGTIGRFASGIAIGAAALATFNKLLNTQRQFDVINSGLVTATGSAEDAAIAFEALRDFATTTPYDLQQVSESFVKLVNLGLTPSERALTSYGNTASAMGKDLNQMIEAVADASTGEFERLKEFGIRASKQGDQVRFTFRGVSETVAFESGAIEEYLTKLGENNFADAMSNRMKTLDGALSNLGDAWDQTFLNISQSGVGDMIADLVNIALAALEGLNEWLLSGELEGTIASLGESFGPWVSDAIEAVDIVSTALFEFTDDLNRDYPGEMEVLSSAWEDFPENIRAVIQIAATHVAWFVEQVGIAMDTVEGYFKAIEDGWGGDQLADVYARAQEASERNKMNLSESIDLIFQERDATIEAAKAAHQAALDRAEERRKEREERRAAMAGQDRLAGYGVDRPTGGTGGGEEADKAAERARKAYESLVESLQTEEEALAESYSRRRVLIEEHTAAESELRQELMRRLDEWRDEGMAGIEEAQRREFENVRQSLMTQEEAIEASYQRRRRIVEEAEGVSAEVRARTLERLERERAEDLAREQADRQSRRDRLVEQFLSEEELARQSRDRQLEEQRAGYEQGLIDWEEYQRNKAAIEERFNAATVQAIRDQQVQALTTYGGTLGALGQMMAQFAHGHGKNAERMFKLSKALNMAQAIMSMAAGIMEAQKEPNMYMRIAESIRIAALGAVQIAAIQSQRFSGAYDKGGRIPAGKFGIVGERGMEFVEGPANVTGREDTARLLRQAAEGGDVTTNHVSIHVHLGENGATRATTDSRTEGGDAEQAKRLGQLIDLRVRDVLIREQRQGGMLSPNR